MPSVSFQGVRKIVKISGENVLICQLLVSIHV